MEDYKGKYEHLLKFIKDLYPHMSDYCKEKAEEFIPELKENEDERIRKEIIAHYKETIDNICAEEVIPKEGKILVANMRKWIAWLEKH